MKMLRVVPLTLAVSLSSLAAWTDTCPNGGGEVAFTPGWYNDVLWPDVPAGCTKVQVKVWGCGGGRGSSASGGAGGYAQGFFQPPGTSALQLSFDQMGGSPGTGTGPGCVSRVVRRDTGTVLVVAAGGAGGGRATAPYVAGRGGAGGGEVGQSGENLVPACSQFANGGGGAGPLTVGAGGGGQFTGSNGQPPDGTQTGAGGAGALNDISGAGSRGHLGGGGAGGAIYCGTYAGAGGGGGSSWVDTSVFSATSANATGVWSVPGNAADADRQISPTEWAGDGETSTTPARRNRTVVRWRGPNGFFDVSPTSPYAPWIAKLACNGVTGGCGGGNYCPSQSVTREQMAPFLLVSKEGAGYVPPACTPPGPFNDVLCSSSYAKWIQELVARGVTSGCGGGNYCPTAPVTREQMAVFLLVTKEGAGYVPPACIPPGPFNDVLCSSPYARWIQELVARGITTGCGGGNYCPTAPVTREVMAVMLGTTFALPACP